MTMAVELRVTAITQARSKQTLFGQAMICTHTYLGGSGDMTPQDFFFKSTPLKTLFMGFSAKFNFRIFCQEKLIISTRNRLSN